MINKIKYFFKTENYKSNYNESLEELKQEAREYFKNTNEYCYIYNKELNTAFDKNGIIIYSSDIEIRNFEAEEEVNRNV